MTPEMLYVNEGDALFRLITLVTGEEASPKSVCRRFLERRIGCRLADWLQGDAPMVGSHFKKAPPVGNYGGGVFHMAGVGHQSHGIKHLTVDLLLGGEASERVALTLDLETVQRPVDCSNIHPHAAVSQAELVDDERVLPLASTEAGDLCVKLPSDVYVSDRAHASILYDS